MKIILKQGLRTPTGKLKAGDEVIIVCDNDDLPLDNFWRNRIKDSAIDNCLEVINEGEIIKTKNKK